MTKIIENRSEYKFSDENVENLSKLVHYLEGLPKDYKHFGMNHFLIGSNSADSLENYLRENGGVQHCGTAACAVGHGPSAGILFNEYELRKNYRGEYEPMWDIYTLRFISKDAEKSASEMDGNTEDYFEELLFNWCFGSTWSDTDDTPQGAAARIRYLLAGKPLPEDDRDEEDYYNPDRYNLEKMA